MATVSTSRSTSGLWWVIACVVVALCGCSTGAARGSADADAPARPEQSAPATIVVRPVPVPAGVHLSFVQQRIDEGTRRSQVRVVNGTDHALRVRSVAVDWAGFPAGPQRSPYVVGSQQTVDLPYRLPRAACRTGVAAEPIRGVVRTRRGALRRRMTADGRRFLTRIHETTCRTRRVDATVDLRLADRFRAAVRGGRPVLRGHLVLLRPPGPGRRIPVTVDDVQGSVLFALSLAGGRTGRTLAPAAGRLAVPVVVRDGGRCDPHSRGQSTQTFAFRAYVGLGRHPEVSRLLVPSPSQERRLLHFLDRACRPES